VSGAAAYGVKGVGGCLTAALVAEGGSLGEPSRPAELKCYSSCQYWWVDEHSPKQRHRVGARLRGTVTLDQHTACPAVAHSTLAAAAAARDSLVGRPCQMTDLLNCIRSRCDALKVAQLHGLSRPLPRGEESTQVVDTS
jgi:hypothetical protein